MLPPANDSSDYDSDNSNYPCPLVCHRLYSGPGSECWTGCGGTTADAQRILTQGNLIEGVTSVMGNGNGGGEGGERGAKGDHNTGHVGITLAGNSLHNYARGICHHRGEHICEPKLPE